MHWAPGPYCWAEKSRGPLQPLPVVATAAEDEVAEGADDEGADDESAEAEEGGDA